MSLSVAVIAAGGLIAFQKQDGASMLRWAIGFGALDEAAAQRPHFIVGSTQRRTAEPRRFEKASCAAP